MKVKITRNKLIVGRSITVELLEPVRINGKPTHKFVYTKTLKTRLWNYGPLTESAKKKLYEFWRGLEYFLREAKPASRARIIAQVEAVIPRLSHDDFDAMQREAERVESLWKEEMSKASKYDHLPIELLCRRY